MANNATPAKRTPARKAAPAKKTTPAKKAPAKKTTPTVVAELPEPPEVVAEPEQSDHATILLRGRSMRVVMPRAEQLAIWARTGARLRSIDLATLDVTEVSKLINRTIRVVESVLPDPADHEWLEDQMLDAGMALPEAVSIVTLALDALNARTQAPTTGPPPKARPRR